MSRSCVLIAADSRMIAEQAARSVGFEPRLTMTKADCAKRVGRVRQQARTLGIRTTVIHSADWERELLPQLYEFAALRLKLPVCVVVVGRGEVQIPLSRSTLALRAGTIPLSALAGMTLVAGEALRLRRPVLTTETGRDTADPQESMLAIWPLGPSAKVGGAVIHMAGILAAFRRRGMRIGLLSAAVPPLPLAELVDELEIVPSIPEMARVTGEIGAIYSNRAARAAGERLLVRVRPAFIYQRNAAFVVYGADLARRAGVPFVLEWNNSEVWARRHWHVQNPLKRMFNPLAAAMERRVLRESQVIAAVSAHSALEAVEVGAAPSHVLTLPNGVDVDAIDRALSAAPAESARSGRRVGWVGSFDPWHGADVLIRSLTLLPDDVSALLIGDGGERQRCQSLVDELGLADRVEFTGPLPHADAVSRLSGCDVLASPHVPMPQRPFFGSPTKIFEYMAIGRPIVASALEQISEILEHGRTAVLVEPADVASLARGILDVLERPDRGRALGDEARREAHAKHAWDARAASIVAKLGDSDSRALSAGIRELPGGD